MKLTEVSRERTICRPIPLCSRPVILLANNLIATSLLASYSFESGQKRSLSSTHHLPPFFINRHQNLEASYIERSADVFQLTQGFKRRRNERWMRTKKTRVRWLPYFTTSNAFSKLRNSRRGWDSTFMFNWNMSLWGCSAHNYFTLLTLPSCYCSVVRE